MTRHGEAILINGGSTGIVAETARLAERGARVAIAARREDKLHAVVAAIVANFYTQATHASSVARAIAFRSSSRPMSTSTRS
jgi:Short-chain dehydrogenases of various substrate specificities